MPILFYINTNSDTTKKMMTTLKPDVIISPIPPSVPNITYSHNDNQVSLNPSSLKVYNKPDVSISVHANNKINFGGSEVQIFTPAHENDINPGIEAHVEASVGKVAETTDKNVTNNPIYDISVRADKMGRIYSRPSSVNNTASPICLDIGDNKRYGIDLDDDIYKSLNDTTDKHLMISDIPYSDIKSKIIHFFSNDGKVTERFDPSSKKENNSKGGGYKTKMSKLNFNKKKRSKKLKKY